MGPISTIKRHYTASEKAVFPGNIINNAGD